MTLPRAELSEPAAPVLARRSGLIKRATLTVEVTSAYLRARRQLRRGSLESVLAALRARSAAVAEPPAPVTLAQAQRLGRVVARVLRLLPGDTRCLVRSLVLTQLLSRRGIATTLVIGARTGPDFLAHAWVECEGEPVLPAGDGSFGRLAEL